MPSLKVTPLAFESLGDRSSAPTIESDDLKFVINHAVSLAPTLNDFEGDHHFANDMEYRMRITPVLEAEKKAGVAAEFLDVEPSLLEARRKELFWEAEN
jgi:predicted metallo-beta-lactamase superfamily hydrolase